jgi:phenylpyruvate tautomerase PptA (4-oxalocrotonate tautomerase family)
MPFVNVKLVKNRWDAMQKQALVDGLLDICCKYYDTDDPQLTVIKPSMNSTKPTG